MHILVTRPLPDAWQLKTQIERLGHEASLAPLIEIVPEDLTLEAFQDASGIIATSQNGLRSLSLSGLVDNVKRLQVYCVGEATAKLAQDLKLANVTAGRGTAADLVPVIIERHKTRKGPVVHLAGDHLAYDLKGAIEAGGIPFREVVAYRSVAAQRLPVETVAALKTGRLHAVTLMSPRTAEIWTSLAARSGLQAELNKLVHICLSKAVADKLQLAPDARIEIAAGPKTEDMLSIVKGLAAHTGRE